MNKTKKTYKPRTEAQKIARRERDRKRAAEKRAAKANAPAPAKTAIAKKVAKKPAKISPEERLLKALGITPPKYCDAELNLGASMFPFRRALRKQANAVAIECRTVIDAMVRLMKLFDHRVKDVAITSEEETPALPPAKKAKKTAKK